MAIINQFKEIQESVQGTAHHLYGENSGIQALSRADLIVRIETMAQQMATMQEKLQDHNQMVIQQQQEIHEVIQQQQEIDEQAEQLVQMLQASEQPISQQLNQPTPPIAAPANPPANPLQAVQQGLRSLQQQVPGGQEGSGMM